MYIEFKYFLARSSIDLRILVVGVIFRGFVIICVPEELARARTSLSTKVVRLEYSNNFDMYAQSNHHKIVTFYVLFVYDELTGKKCNVESKFFTMQKFEN